VQLVCIGMEANCSHLCYFSREETERVGELQTGNEDAALSGDALASGAEGVKEAIHGFSEA
jgi:hypothetical protein